MKIQYFMILILVQVAFHINAEALTSSMKISAEEFSGIIQSMSENDDWYFDTHWAADEPNYWRAIESFERNGGTGGIYAGVGTEPNFAYITNIKPEISFIVDPRPIIQVQHLLYKVLMEISETPGEFFERLFSRESDRSESAGVDVDIEGLINSLHKVQGNPRMIRETADLVNKMLSEKYDYYLDEKDYAALIFILSNFCRHNVDLSFWGRLLPLQPWITFGEFLTIKDDNGNFVTSFNNIKDYEHLRHLQLENRIIPIVGDLSGDKAFKGIAEFARGAGLSVSSIYVSSFEEVLFDQKSDSNFVKWAHNVRRLPVSDKSVIIRMGKRYLTQEKKVISVNLNHVQLVKTFLANIDAGIYKDYTDLIDLNRGYLPEKEVTSTVPASRDPLTRKR